MTTTCFRCDTEIETTLPGSIQNALCDDCKARLQRKVDEAVRGIEHEMVNGVFRKKARPRPWYVPSAREFAFFWIGVLSVIAPHALGWWR